MGLLVAATLASTPGDREALARARELYNQEQYEAAISAAETARRSPDLADAALLVLARAQLERYRRDADSSALTSAREALVQIRPLALDSADRAQLIIGLGESLYLDDRFGAAAELFGSVLERSAPIPPSERDEVLDWWASALDRQAQTSPLAERPILYRRMVDRMEDELRADPMSAPASYWVVVGLRGLGELGRAWAAAAAGWVRAIMAGTQGDMLRIDLDRLVREAIIPERVHEIVPSRDSTRDAEQVTAGMRADWEAFKDQWTKNPEP